MGFIYCPVCSRAVSSQTKIKICPQCYHPLDMHEWKEENAKRMAIEKEKENKKLEEIINKAGEEKDKKKIKDKKKEEKRKKQKIKKSHKNMTKVAIEKERVREAIKKQDNHERLKTITKNSLIKAYNIQKKTSGWTFYNENDIVQRTLENRFNFLLVAYTLLLAAYFQPDVSNNEKLAILIIGFLLVGFLSLAIYRTTNRFNITLNIVHSLEQHDVAPIIHKENECKHNHPFNKLGRKNSITGKLIPFLMLLSIAVGIAFNIAERTGLIDLIKKTAGIQNP